jgi:hypothetical protein
MTFWCWQNLIPHWDVTGRYRYLMHAAPFASAACYRIRRTCKAEYLLFCSFRTTTTKGKLYASMICKCHVLWLASKIHSNPQLRKLLKTVIFLLGIRFLHKIYHTFKSRECFKFYRCRVEFLAETRISLRHYFPDRLGSTQHPPRCVLWLQLTIYIQNQVYANCNLTSTPSIRL